MTDRLRIVRMVEEEVGTPRNDGARGSALYSVPFELSGTPSMEWSDAFVASWNNPQSFTTSHRPGIACVRGRRVVLERTTIEEVEHTHKATLQQAVDAANEYVEALEIERANKDEQDRLRAEAHRQRVKEAATRIKFD